MVTSYPPVVPHSTSTSSSSTPTIGPVSSMRPRPHSSSISSVHFAQPVSRRVASFEPPTKSSTDPSHQSSERHVSPPTTPAPTPRNGSPLIEGLSARKANGSALAHGKRASVVTGGYESSSSESPSGSRSRRRAATLALPVPISRSSSDKSLHRDKRMSTISRHSSRDILRSSLLRPHPSVPNPPSRVSSIQSSRSRSSRAESSPGKAKRSQSPVRRELRPIATSPDSSSRKGKERAEPRRDLFASSLGSGGAALTADQINALLADSDVATAIRLMGTPSTSIPPPRSSSPPDDLHPYLVSAPPALTDAHTRNRTISMSTTASSPRQMNRSSSTDIPSASTLAHRRRASSRATLGTNDGGHVPFTHHIPPSTVESDDGEETESAPSITVIPGLSAPEKKRKRLSSIFGIKQKAEIQVASEPDEEKLKRDAEMRDKERRRRQDEMDEDRYYRALQQVSAHPHCEALADHAKLHLWALYGHIFDGVDNPPRFNPVAILRWKYKVEEQDLARKAWESRKTHLGASVESFPSTSRSRDPFARWAYTIEDIERYKANEGHVEYFIPPREETALASVDELTPLEHQSSNGSVKTEEQVRSNPSDLGRSDSRQSFEPLSRSPSNDVRHRKISHRAHQSLGHLGSVVGKIRQRTLGDQSDSAVEDSPLRAHPRNAERLDVPRSRADRLFRRPHDHSARGSMTDEETNSRRRVPSDHRSTVAVVPAPVVHTEPLVIDEAIDEARKKEEATLYAERSRHLKAARLSLDHVNATVQIVEGDIRYYTVQLEQTQRSAKLAGPHRDQLQVANHRLSDVRSAVDALDHTRVDAADKLRGMVKNINRLQAKTAEVDHWAKKNMSEIEELQVNRNRLLSRRNKPSFWRRPEHDMYFKWTTKLLGAFIQALYKIIRYILRVFGWRGVDKDGRKATRKRQALFMAGNWLLIGFVWVCWWMGGY